MSLLDPLLDIQKLDLACDAARSRSEKFSERASVPILIARLAEIDARKAKAASERTAIQAEEEALGIEVSQVVRDIESAEVERYSGKRFDQDEAAAHNESQRELRERKETIEDREMELLESLEEVDAQIQSEQSARETNRVEATRVDEAIRDMEAKVAKELDGLVNERSGLTSSIPVPVLKAYDRVRAQPNAGGRGAARLSDSRCGACQIKLPSHEKAKMLAEPEDALIQCPQCRRILVR